MGRWLRSSRIEEIAPHLFFKISTSIARARTVGAWLIDCMPNLEAAALQESLGLWEVLADIHLDPMATNVVEWS
jgi:nitrate reductase beta subunit